jgi:VWFA-related protein
MMGRVPATTAALSVALVAMVAGQQTPRYVERVDVARILIDVRVLDSRGSPVKGLTADDFKVRIDGKTMRVDSSEWVGAPDDDEIDPRATAASAPTSPAAGRLIVFLFQKSLDPSRIVGLMRMLIDSRRFLSTLGASDRVAVLSFDSHLKIWTDFTNDSARLEPILERGVLLQRPKAVEASGGISLLERLDPEQGRRTYSIEKALQRIGEALEPLPGSKSIVLFGHGMGRLGRTGVSMEAGYDEARHALVAARASVFSLDVTDADYHSLEAGLRLVSDQTGGFYAKTNLLPDIAMRRLAGALAGYYVLFVDKPRDSRGRHDIDVQLTRRKGTVLARSSFAG